MQMNKKILPSMVLAMAALASCQQEEVLPQVARAEIRFSVPAISVETRNTFKDELKTGDSFGVLGYCLAYDVVMGGINYNTGSSEWSGKKSICPPDVFYKQEVTIMDGVCSYNPLEEWYRDGGEDGNNTDMTDTDNYLYTFFGYYPYGSYSDNSPIFDVIQPTSQSTTGAPILDFYMPFTDNSGLTTDLSLTGIPDAMWAMAENHKKSDGNVQMEFAHITCGLGFQVNNYSKMNVDGEDTGQDLHIRNIKLSGTFYRKAHLDFTGSELAVTYPTDETYQGTYTMYTAPDQTNGTYVSWQDTEAQNVLAPENYVRLLPGSSADVEGNGGFLGPNNTTNEDGTRISDITVSIEYKFGDDTDWVTESYHRPGEFNPRPGVRYTAQLNWVGNAFIVIVRPDNDDLWEDDGDSDITFE